MNLFSYEVDGETMRTCLGILDRAEARAARGEPVALDRAKHRVPRAKARRAAATPEEIAEVHKRRARGEKIIEIAEATGIKRSRVEYLLYHCRPEGREGRLRSGDWFDLPVPGLKRQRANHRAEVEALKKEHGIFTHLCRGGGDWLALSMPECCAALSGYGLTEIERTDGGALMAGYCRLLDEAGLVEEGHKTERAAVAALLERLRSNTKTSQRGQS